MALPVTIPNTFANATSSIPLSQLDTNFSTLANAVNGLNSGSETLANLKATTANVGVLTVTGNATIGDASTDTVTLNSTLTANTAVIFAAGTSAAPSITTTGDLNTGIFFPAADTIAFAEGGAEAMRIDSSGNLGLGVTPSAWYSNQRAFQIGDVGSFRVASSSVFGMNNNAYFAQATTDWRYSVTGFSTRYDQESGQHRWYTAPSGTAGNAISFTQAMTLDASGNLGVGETSIAADTRLHLKSAGDIKLKVETTNNTLASGNAALVLTTGSYGYSIQNLTTTAGSAGVLRFYDNTAAVERARITSGGLFEMQSPTANGAYVKSGSSITLASNATINITNATAGACLVLVYNTGDGAGAVFFANYLDTAVKVAGDGAATDTGSTFALYKNAGSHVTTIRNRYATSQTFRIAVYSAEANP